MFYNVDIETLPKGWKPCAYRDVHIGENILTKDGVIPATAEHTGQLWLVVEEYCPDVPKRVIIEFNAREVVIEKICEMLNNDLVSICTCRYTDRPSIVEMWRESAAAAANYMAARRNKN